jgi:large subunit ribosomal protein L18
VLNKKESRLRRSKQTRTRIAGNNIVRLSVFRSNMHIYASIVSEDGMSVIASASTVAADIKSQLEGGASGSNVSGAELVGRLIAEKAKAAGIDRVAFDRSGFAYHGRVKALAEAARGAGLQF